MPKKSDALFSISAFTGTGGMDLGFEAAGFKPLLCIEKDKWSRETIKINRPDWNLSNPGDIDLLSTTLKPKDLGIKPGDLAAIMAGPPCQPFSKAAQWASNGRSGMNDTRSACLTSLLNLVKVFRPKAVFIENVQGFVAGHLSAQDHLAEGFDSINYTLFGPYLVNACDYGVPQKRDRALLIALRDGSHFEPPEPTHSKPVTAWDAIGNLSGVTVPSARGRWKDLLPSIPEGSNYLWHTPRGGGLPLFGYRTRYWSFLLKLSKSLPSWTLPAHPGPSAGPFHWDNRPLSIEEALRLQTFPASWKVAGSYRIQMRQVGNATPPLLAENFARALGTQVFGFKYDSPCMYSIAYQGPPPPPAKLAPVPQRYLKQQFAYSSHPGTGKGPRPTGTLRERAERLSQEVDR